jgi:hypothetical protein
MIEVSEMDLWGQESNVSHIDAPPYIDSFSVTSMGNGNNWVFQGHVNGTNLDGLIVTLGGITQLENQTVTVGADGSFTITIDMGAPFQGNITAVTSQDGVSSNLVNCIV